MGRIGKLELKLTKLKSVEFINKYNKFINIVECFYSSCQEVGLEIKIHFVPIFCHMRNVRRMIVLMNLEAQLLLPI